MALRTREVEKPWGRVELPTPFSRGSRQRTGEIWFQHPTGEDLPLLVKYIFTSEKLSIQVHPDDNQARQRGLANGKTECWYILEAKPEATLGLGLTENLSADEIRSAALDGSIEHLMNWVPVRAGDFVFVPAGTIHAAGAGLALLELQQNADVTYRIYDYGRPRELHLDEAIQVSRPGFDLDACFKRAPVKDGVLIDCPHFSLLRTTCAKSLPENVRQRRRWIMPLAGSATAGGITVDAGGCLLAAPKDVLSFAPSSTCLVAVEGSLHDS